MFLRKKLTSLQWFLSSYYCISQLLNVAAPFKWKWRQNSLSFQPRKKNTRLCMLLGSFVIYSYILYIRIIVRIYESKLAEVIHLSMCITLVVLACLQNCNFLYSPVTLGIFSKEIVKIWITFEEKFCERVNVFWITLVNILAVPFALMLVLLFLVMSNNKQLTDFLTTTKIIFCITLTVSQVFCNAHIFSAVHVYLYLIMRRLNAIIPKMNDACLLEHVLILLNRCIQLLHALHKYCGFTTCIILIATYATLLSSILAHKVILLNDPGILLFLVVVAFTEAAFMTNIVHCLHAEYNKIGSSINNIDTSNLGQLEYARVQFLKNQILYQIIHNKMPTMVLRVICLRRKLLIEVIGSLVFFSMFAFNMMPELM